MTDVVKAREEAEKALGLLQERISHLHDPLRVIDANNLIIFIRSRVKQLAEANE